jgi:hypothetical protein
MNSVLRYVHVRTLAYSSLVMLELGGLQMLVLKPRCKINEWRQNRTHLLRSLKCLNGAHDSTSWQKSSIFVYQHRRHEASSSFERCLRIDLRSILSCLLLLLRRRRQPCKIFHLAPLFFAPALRERRKTSSKEQFADTMHRSHLKRPPVDIFPFRSTGSP